MDFDTPRLGYVSFLSLLVVVAVCLAARVIYLFMENAQYFPINTVKITASYQHITHKQLEKVLADYLKASFFALNIKRLKDELAAFDWASQIEIARVWPDTLTIRLIEKTPVATWNNKLITETGAVFNSEQRTNDFSLPHLLGPVAMQSKVMKIYREMDKILSVYGLHAAALEWHDDKGWDLKLVNNVALHLGMHSLRMRLLRFCKAYPFVIAAFSEKVAGVDLRYPRGMAVQWKKETGR